MWTDKTLIQKPEIVRLDQKAHRLKVKGCTSEQEHERMFQIWWKTWILRFWKHTRVCVCVWESMHTHIHITVKLQDTEIKGKILTATREKWKLPTKTVGLIAAFSTATTEQMTEEYLQNTEKNKCWPRIL